jgi:ATP-binding cassette, subfamily B, bacterial PglK
MKNKSLKSSLSEVFSLFERSEKKKIVIVRAALSVTAVESHTPGNHVQAALRFLNLERYTFQTQVAILAVVATFLLILRTICSISLSKRTLLFLSRRGAVISTRLVKHLFSRSLNSMQSYSKQEIMFATTVGVQALTLGVLGNFLTMLADLALLIIIAAGLLIVDPLVAISSIFLFSFLGYTLYRSMRDRSVRIGQDEIKYGIRSNQKLSEFIDTYREAIVRNRRDYYINEIGALRYRLADVLAEKTFLPNISKYVVETSVVLGALIIAGLQFAISDATHAVGALSIFLAAGTRVAPAVLRIQQNFIQIRTSIGSGELAGKMLRLLSREDRPLNIGFEPNLNYDGFSPSIEFKNVTFKYHPNSPLAINDLSISICPGQKVAFVGPSGAGKSTLIDLLLGVNEPQLGEISISAMAPLEVFSEFPGAVAYVPQKVSIALGTIRENIALGLNPESFSDDLFWEALEKAQLANFVRTIPEGLDSKVGDEGNMLSGGERQRLGIARAIFTRPKLIILDEATSALDVDTEHALTDMLHAMGEEITVVLVAHRLSSVKNCDQVIYLNHGVIVGSGTFEELQEMVPDFERQVNLMDIRK